MRLYDGGGIRRNHKGEKCEEGILEEISSRRNRGGGIMEGESWRMHHGGVIIEEAARRRQPGGGSQEEAARRHQETPRGARRHPGGSQEASAGTWEAARRHPDLYLCLCLHLSQFCYFY